MMKTLQRIEPYTWTVFRVTVGIVMAAHGWLKLTDVPGTVAQFGAIGLPAPEVLVWFAIAGELFGGIGLILGALTRIASFGVLCVMTVAILSVHIGNGLMAVNNGFEYPLVMLTAALAFIARGAGPFSLDSQLRRPRVPPVTVEVTETRRRDSIGRAA